MNLDMHYLISALGANLRYLIVVVPAVMVLFFILVKDKESRSWAIRGACAFLVVSVVAFTVAVGRINFPAFDNLWENVLSETVWADNSTPIATSTHHAAAIPPPAVALQEEANIGEPEPTPMADGPVPEVVPDESETTAGPIATELESSVFDLGSSTIAGTFEDDTPYIIHRVASGETIYGLSRQYGVAQSDLLDRNGLRIGDVLHVGTEIRIPRPGAQ